MRFLSCVADSVECTREARERSRLAKERGWAFSYVALGLGLQTKPGLRRLQQVTQGHRTLFLSSRPLWTRTAYFSPRPRSNQVLETTCHVPIGACRRRRGHSLAE